MTTVPVETSHPDPVPLESTGASSEKQTDLGLEKLSLSKGPESASNDANTDLDMSIIGEGEMTPCFSDEASDLAAGAGDPVSGPPSTEAAAKDDDGLASGEGAQDPRDGKTADKSDSKLGRLTNWSAKKLDELASASKGAITTAMIRLIKEYLPGTKLIFVMGKSGQGKTTILKELTGLDLKVGKELKSGTREYQVYPSVIDGKQYLFVDTPGFGAADLDDMAVFRNILDCISALGAIVDVSGVMYVHGPPEERVFAHDTRTMRWIQCFCGAKLFKNIAIVTTKWDKHSEDGFDDAQRLLGKLKEDKDVAQMLDPLGHRHGAVVYHHGMAHVEGPHDAKHSLEHVLSMKRQAALRGQEVRNFVKRQYGDAQPVKPQILWEMERGIGRFETEAAKVLKSNVTKTAVRIRDDGEAVLVSLCEDRPGDRETEVPREEHESAGVDQQRHESQGPAQEPAQEPAEEPAQEAPQADKTWLQGILDWIFVGVRASTFFMNAREEKYESGKDESPAWDPLGDLRSWWSSLF